VPGSEDASVGIQHGSAGGTVRRLRVHALTVTPLLRALIQDYENAGKTA